MEKQFIVKTTVHGIAKKGGKKVVIKPSPEPQNVPGALVKELLASGVIEEYVVKGKAPSSVNEAGGASSDGPADDDDDDNTDDDADAPGAGDGVTGD